MNSVTVAFRPLAEPDLPDLHRWFNAPHVSRWWNMDGTHHPTLEHVRRKYAPRIRRQAGVRCYVILLDGTPAGMIQSYDLDDEPVEKALFGVAGKCAGLDLLIGETAFLHRGLGSVVIREFLRQVVFADPAITCALADPNPENEIAVRAYQKAGFEYQRTVWYEPDKQKEDIYTIRRDAVMNAVEKPSAAAYEPVAWLGDRVKILDQTQLPAKEVYLETDDYRAVAEAIKELKVRGAPAIGIAGAYAVVLGALSIKAADKINFLKELQTVIDVMAATRPTARNLFYALERCKQAASGAEDPAAIRRAVIAAAQMVHREEADATGQIGRNGAALLQDGWTVLTHCNTGPLATGGRGTALGVILTAREQGKNTSVYATETRPLLQGARLTAWELQKAGAPVTLITDSMAAYLMQLGKVDCVITGADCIAANGDTANKIGTYALAVLAGAHGIPFYIAAPVSTIDVSIPGGREIPIEERAGEEITKIRGVPIAPEGVGVFNPAFDVTPSRLITAIITDRGVVTPPYRAGIKAILP